MNLITVALIGLVCTLPVLTVFYIAYRGTQLLIGGV